MALKKRIRYARWIVLFVPLAITAHFWTLGNQSRNMNPVIGLTGGHLGPCDPKPNCVSTESQDEEHRIAPIPIKVPWPQFKGTLLLELVKQGGMVMKDEGEYFHAIFVSGLFSFTDDVEIFYDSKNSRLEMRSASRVGHSDLGVNRKRLESLRHQLLMSVSGNI